MLDLTRVRLQVEELERYLFRDVAADVTEELVQLGQRIESLEQSVATVQLEGPDPVAGHAENTIVIAVNASRALLEWEATPERSRQQEIAALVQEMYKAAKRFEKTARKYL